VRLRVLTELPYFHNRDSKLYPPFLRALLRDASPKVRWEAAARLRKHHIFLDLKEVPDVVEVHPGKLLDLENPESMAWAWKSTAAANRDSPGAGWAISALALFKDRDVPAAARGLLSSKNIFVRFSAAMALLELGEEAEAAAELEKIVDASAAEDASGFYRSRAAEVLVRLGRREHLGTLIQVTAERAGAGYADSGHAVLCDLTGRYFATAAEWQRWWQDQPAP